MRAIWALFLYVLCSSASQQAQVLLEETQQATKRLLQLQHTLRQSLVIKRSLLFPGGLHIDPPPAQNRTPVNLRPVLLDGDAAGVFAAAVACRLDQCSILTISPQHLTVYNGGGMRVARHQLSLPDVYAIASQWLGGGLLAVVSHQQGASCFRLSGHRIFSAAEAAFSTPATHARAYLQDGSARYIIGDAGGKVHLLKHACQHLGSVVISPVAVTHIAVTSAHLLAAVASGAQVHLLQLDRRFRVHHCHTGSSQVTSVTIMQPGQKLLVLAAHTDGLVVITQLTRRYSQCVVLRAVQSNSPGVVLAGLGRSHLALAVPGAATLFKIQHSTEVNVWQAPGITKDADLLPAAADGALRVGLWSDQSGTLVLQKHNQLVLVRQSGVDVLDDAPEEVVSYRFWMFSSACLIFFGWRRTQVNI